MSRNTTIPKGAHYILAYAKNTHGEFPTPVSVKIIDNTHPCVHANDTDCPEGVEVVVAESEITVSIRPAKKEAGIDGYALHWGRSSCSPDVNCAWRQTGGCVVTGERESKNDLGCGDIIPKGASGYCDCDGDGKLGANERGCTCTRSTGTASCKSLCMASSKNGLIKHLDIAEGPQRILSLKRAELSACQDTANGATDKDGFGCSSYDGAEGNTEYDDDDFSANTMCCKAGGGKQLNSVPDGTTHVLVFSKNKLGESEHCVDAGFVDEFAPAKPAPQDEDAAAEAKPTLEEEPAAAQAPDATTLLTMLR